MAVGSAPSARPSLGRLNPGTPSLSSRRSDSRTSSSLVRLPRGRPLNLTPFAVLVVLYGKCLVKAIDNIFVHEVHYRPCPAVGFATQPPSPSCSHRRPAAAR